jgi:flavin reductase (DIM6/NTAB) family NADH-FMN oxidoreductase RutF
MRRLVGAVTAVAARMPDGSPVGLAATAVCSVSAEPPTLLVCVNQSSSLGKVIGVGHAFSVNLLRAEHEPLARSFGGMTGLDQAQRFALGAWDCQGPIPLLRDAAATFECRVTHAHESGSHFVLMGAVEAVHLGDEACGALGYLNGGFVVIE